MINLEKAKNEFIKYTNTYDLNNPNIARKIHHSLRVMEYSRKIAESLNLSDEQIKLATLIGLLHDIARFEQWRKYETYNDKISIDHGDLAVEILEKNDFIRNFVETDKYDRIIKIAIKNHNKYEIENLKDEEYLQAKIIRDADKLDIFYQVASKYYKSIEETEKQDISKDVFEEFKNKQCIHKKASQTNLDGLVVVTSFIYDIYFDYSLEIIKNEKYIERIFKQFDFKNSEVKKKIDFILESAQKYLNNHVSNIE